MSGIKFAYCEKKVTFDESLVFLSMSVYGDVYIDLVNIYASVYGIV